MSRRPLMRSRRWRRALWRKRNTRCFFARTRRRGENAEPLNRIPRRRDPRQFAAEFVGASALRTSAQGHFQRGAQAGETEPLSDWAQNGPRRSATFPHEARPNRWDGSLYRARPQNRPPRLNRSPVPRRRRMALAGPLWRRPSPAARPDTGVRCGPAPPPAPASVPLRCGFSRRCAPAGLRLLQGWAEAASRERQRSRRTSRTAARHQSLSSIPPWLLLVLMVTI